MENARHLEDAFDLLGRAAEAAEDRGETDLYVLPGLVYRIAEDAIGRISAEVLDPEAARPAVSLLVLPAFELDALWKVLAVLRRARAGDQGAAEVLGLVQDYGEHCCSPPRTADTFVVDLEKVLTVLTLDIPASRSVASAFALDRAPGFACHTAYEQLAAVWKAAGIRP